MSKWDERQNILIDLLGHERLAEKSESCGKPLSTALYHTLFYIPQGMLHQLDGLVPLHNV